MATPSTFDQMLDDCALELVMAQETQAGFRAEIDQIASHLVAAHELLKKLNSRHLRAESRLDTLDGCYRELREERPRRVTAA